MYKGKTPLMYAAEYYESTDVIKLLLENKEMSMNEIAKALGVTNGALTSHVRMR